MKKTVRSYLETRHPSLRLMTRCLLTRSGWKTVRFGTILILTQLSCQHISPVDSAVKAEMNYNVDYNDYIKWHSEPRLSPVVADDNDFVEEFTAPDGKLVRVIVKRPNGTKQMARTKRPNELAEKYFQSVIHASPDDSTIVFPPGVYEFEPTEENGIPYIFINKRRGLKLVGDGVEIRAKTPKPIIRIQNSVEIEVTGFEINYQWRLATLGTIAEHQGQRYVKIDRRYLESVRKNSHYRRVAAIYQRNVDDEGYKSMPYRHHSTIRILNKAFDVPWRFDYTLGGFFPPKEYGRINGFLLGDKVFIKHTYREGTGFTFRNTADITLSNIKAGSIPGLFMAGTNFRRGLLVKGVTTRKSPLLPLEVIGLGAAGANIINIEGDVAYVNNDFWGANDDGVNVHGNTLEVIAINEKELTVHSSVKSISIQTLKAGEKIVIYDRRLRPKSLGVIQSVEFLEDGKVALQMDRVVNAKPTDFIMRPDQNGRRFVFRNNQVVAAHGRGLLFQGSNGLIDGNVIEDMMDAAIALGPEVLTWRSGGSVVNTSVKNNRIERVATCRYGVFSLSPTTVRSGAISLGGWVDWKDGYYAEGLINHMIEISGNHIQDVPLNGIRIGSSGQVSVHSNSLINTNLFDAKKIGTAKAYGMYPQGAIFLHHSENITIESNEFRNTGPRVYRY